MDLDVDRRDAALFMAHLGTTAGSIWITGDFDGEGATTLADLALLQQHLRQGQASSSAVPEPSTIGLGMRKPSEILIEGLTVTSSRGDRTAIELFLAHLRLWPTAVLQTVQALTAIALSPQFPE